MLAKQKGGFVAVIVHNPDFSVFAQKHRDDADARALHHFILLFADASVKRICPAKAEDTDRGAQQQHNPVLGEQEHSQPN